jgi:hypothetical protein
MTKETTLMERPLSAEQVSLILDISEFTVRKLAQTGELPCMYEKRRLRFNMRMLLEHFSKLESGGASC